MPTKREPSVADRRLWMGMVRVVSHLSRAAHVAIDRAEGFGLSQMTLMGHLRAHGGEARMVDLAVRLQMTKAAITKMVDSLQRPGYVERTADSSDRRVVLAKITPAGASALGRAEAVFHTVIHEGLWEHLSPDETAAVLEVLERVQERLGLAAGAVMPRDPADGAGA